MAKSGKLLPMKSDEPKVGAVYWIIAGLIMLGLFMLCWSATFQAMP